jgi:hypothetical protein
MYRTLDETIPLMRRESVDLYRAALDVDGRANDRWAALLISEAIEVNEVK